MPRVAQPVPPIRTLHVTVEHVLLRSRFAAPMRESDAQDLAPLLDLEDDPLVGLERRSQAWGGPRALDPKQVEAALQSIRDTRDRALFWLIYDGGLRRREALTIDVDDLDWTEQCIPIRAKGDKPRSLTTRLGMLRYLQMDAYWQWKKQRRQTKQATAVPEVGKEVVAQVA